MRSNKFRELLEADKPTVATHVHTTWPSVIETLAHTGLYDYVEFVGKYGPFDLHDLDNMCRAAELHDPGTMIKVDQDPRGYIASRAIGSGFQSVLFSDCRTVEDARECINIVKPETPEDGGTYGVATRRFAYMGYGGSPEYVQALRDIVIVLMIEKKGAVENLEELLSLGQIDMVQWGGSDYSMSVGRAGQRGSDEIKTVEKSVIETAIKMGVPPRAEINTADQAKYYLDLGVRHFCIGTDVTILFQWWKDQGDSLRKAVESA